MFFAPPPLFLCPRSHLSRSPFTQDHRQAAAPARPAAAVPVKKEAHSELDDLLNDLASGPAKATPSSAHPAPARQVPASNELDDLLNDLDAPAPRSKPAPAPVKATPAPVKAAPAPAPKAAPAPAAKAAPVAVDDLDDLLEGLDAPVSRSGSTTSSGGGGGGGGGRASSRTEDLFGDINSSARSAGSGAAPTGGMAPIRNESSGPARGLCAGCNQQVFGEVLQSMGKLWHPEHFAVS